MRDIEHDLDAFDGTFPESWRPKPGDKIVGRLVRYTQGESPYGPRHIAVVEAMNAGGEPYLVGIWLSHAVLVDQFKRLKPKPGERIGVKRLADVPGRGDKRGYAMFKVVVDRPDAGAPDWDKVVVEGEVPAAAAASPAGGELVLGGEGFPF